VELTAALTAVPTAAAKAQPMVARTRPAVTVEPTARLTVVPMGVPMGAPMAGLTVAPIAVPASR
jgi:hypothetical protein